jgi:pyruvate formate lyase activating enzyme
MPLFDPNLGLIAAVQTEKLEDGQGTRSTVLFKGCPLGCLWCPTPELIRPVPDLLYTRESCTSCGSCIAACPHNALAFDEQNFIEVDRSKCSASGECVQACPEDALELVGRYVKVDELIAELIKGFANDQTAKKKEVVFSGGEPLWQAGFTAQVARGMQENGIRTILRTTGDISWCRFEEVLPFIDLVLYPIKAADNDLHRQLTGRDNDLILMNAQLLAQQEIPVHVRLELMPGLNDSQAELQARMDFIAGLGCVKQVDLLPYHLAHPDKYARLGLDNPLTGLPEYGEEELCKIEQLVGSYGIDTRVVG